MIPITEVRVFLSHVSDRQRPPICRAFCTVTLAGCFVIRDVKIIETKNGLIFTMPTRKICDRCPSCSAKNPLENQFCGECGKELPPVADSFRNTETGSIHYYADVCFPINQEFRSHIQEAVLKAYHEEKFKPKEVVDG